MACFIVPAAEAVITTIATKVVKHKEEKSGCESSEVNTLRFSGKLKWLSNMLWGGSALLAFEHLWHGEIVPWAPFLTGAADAESTAAMLGEMATVGVGMALLVTAVWGVMATAAHFTEKKAKRGENT